MGGDGGNGEEVIGGEGSDGNGEEVVGMGRRWEV